MSEYIKKIKNFVFENQRDVLASVLVVLVGIGAFGLGRISSVKATGEGKITFGKAALIPFSNKALRETASVNFALLPEISLMTGGGTVVASKNGSKYHLPWCSGAKSIKEENKIYFSSREEAEKAGYTPAGNCKGL